MARKLGLLGPIIFFVGVAIACLGAWYVIHARPHAGDVIDTIEIDNGDTLVVRGEHGGERAFLELHHGGELAWQALIPHYAGSKGRSGIAWSPTAITVRIERGGRAEVFALTRGEAARLPGYRLAVEHEPITTPATGPITLTDHVRSYEFVGGSDWHQVIAVDLLTGLGVWKVDLGPAPVTGARVEGGIVSIDQGEMHHRLSVVSGHEELAEPVSNPPQTQ